MRVLEEDHLSNGGGRCSGTFDMPDTVILLRWTRSDNEAMKAYP